MYTYEGSRHHAPIREDYDTLEEAEKRAQHDADSGDAHPQAITNNGQTVRAHDDLCTCGMM